MLKKLVLLTVVMLSSFSLSAQAATQNDITMLVVPHEVLPIQIAQDISRRYPVLIVSYKLVLGEVKIYAWDDEHWIPVSVEDYTSGTFFANRPKHAVVIEHERFHAPDEVIPNSIWCESAARLASTDPRVMLHLLGLEFDFPYRHWDQFAKRYGYALEEINPTLENVHWWNLRADTLIQKYANRDSSKDAGKLQPLDTLPPPAIKPAPIEEPKRVPEVKAPAPESVKLIKVNAPAKEKAAPPAKPVPVAKPAPVAKPVPAVKPVPTIKAPVQDVKIPEANPAPQPAALIDSQSAPEPVATETPATAPTEKVTENPVVKPASIVESDPFASDEVPAAEIVVPQTPKKPWWKF